MSFIIRNTTGGTVAVNDLGLTLDIPAAQIQDVLTVADVAGDLNSTFFLLESMSTKYYVWYDVSSGGTDPGIAGSAETGGRTGIEVDIVTNDTADAVATATRSAVGGLADFSTGGATNTVTITNAAVGDVLDAFDGAAGTGFTFSSPATQGAGARDIIVELASAVAVSQDLLDQIAAGNIEVLDPSDGTTVLSEADSILAVQVANDPHFSGPAGFDFWATFTADVGSTTADIPLDTLTIIGTGTIDTDITGDTLTINGTAGAGQNLFETITGDTGSATADTTTDSLALVGATNGGITTIATDDPEVVTFSITPIDLTTGVATLAVGDFVIVSDSADTATTIALKYTFTDVITDLNLLTSGNQVVFTSVTGDSGTATADTNADSIALVGATNGGIVTVATDGPEQVTFALDIDDLTAGVTLALADQIAVSDAGAEVRFTFTDVVEDLDIPNAITVNGFVVRTAADTYASRTLDASTDEDELGITITDGDGVSGDPQIGLDIVGLTDPAADMASTDEFPVHDKSEGTGGANRKMSGQNISDGALSIAGLTGLTVTTIGSQEVLTLVDTTRASKILSVETTTLTWSEAHVNNNDFLNIGGVGDADTGYVIPLNATLVKAMGSVADNNGNAKDIDLYVDGVLGTSSIIVFTGSPALEEDTDVTLNVDITAGERIHLRASGTGGRINDVVITLWLKWRG